MHLRRCTSLFLLAAGTLVSVIGGRVAIGQPSGRVERGQFTHEGATRPWRLFVPTAQAADAEGAPAAGLVLLLHGCTQDASDIVTGTRTESYALRAGFLVLTPEQPVTNHPQKCWNWYAPADGQAGAREVAWLSALLTDMLAKHSVKPGQVHVVGLSAGAAMGALLVTAQPARFASLTMASGVPVGAASTVPDALLAMREGPREGVASAEVVRERMGAHARAVPIVLLHGDDDTDVSPKNRDAALVQWRDVLRGLGVSLSEPISPPASGPFASASGTRWTDAAGRIWLESWRFGGVGHAGSGGDPAGTYVAPTGANATDITFAFIAAQTPTRAGEIPR